ncbi:MAG: ABC transporter ATP-binding protein [Mycobacteriales bacterium]
MTASHVTALDGTAPHLTAGPYDTGVHPASRLVTEHLTLGYRSDRQVVRELDLSVPTGAVTAIVGANGCGKSTVLRALARLLRPQDGAVLLDGQDLHRLPTRDVARQLGLLPQGPVTPDGITVSDLVGRGRTPHTSVFRQWSSADQRAVDDALATTGLTAMAHEQVDSLSGGQRQRAWLAMVVAQDTSLLLLDEPTTYLDMAHQLDVLELVRDLHRVGRTVVMVLHDVNQAARYADHLVAMRDGRIVAAGSPSAVLTPALIADVFGVRCRVLTDPDGDTPLIVPVARL